MMHIVIWDIDTERISQIDKNLNTALNEMGVRAVVASNADPLSLERENLLPRLPVLEINGLYWSLKPGKVFSKEECQSLLRRIRADKGRLTHLNN
jgi:hypothetical protein